MLAEPVVTSVERNRDKLCRKEEEEPARHLKGKKKLKKIFFKKGGQSIVQNCIYITVHVIFFLPCTAFFFLCSLISILSFCLPSMLCVWCLCDVLQQFARRLDQSQSKTNDGSHLLKEEKEKRNPLVLSFYLFIHCCCWIFSSGAIRKWPSAIEQSEPANRLRRAQCASTRRCVLCSARAVTRNNKILSLSKYYM